MDFDPVVVSSEISSLSGGNPANDIPDGAPDIQIVPPTVKVHKPEKTRSTISKFEYVGVLTKLAKYLAGIPDISMYLDEPYVNGLINPTELAFELLEAGKFDAILDRGYEQVNYSQLEVNEKWKNMLRDWFKEKQENIRNELVIPFGLE